MSALFALDCEVTSNLAEEQLAGELENNKLEIN